MISNFNFLLSVFKRRWFRRLVWISAFCFLLSAFCFVFRAPLLTSLANAWIINDPLTKADAIVILGGSLETRPAGAAELYQQGLANRILYMDVKFEPAKLLGLGQSEPELTRAILEKSGVPGSALTCIGDQVTSTWEEAQALRAWMQTNDVRSVIVVTDLFHTRRARWLLRKHLKALNARVQVAPVKNPHYAETNWWQTEAGLVFFQNEWVKLPYYWLKY